jgi:hypothetical protein
MNEYRPDWLAAFRNLTLTRALALAAALIVAMIPVASPAWAGLRDHLASASAADEVAFQANSGLLWTYDTATRHSVNAHLGMAAGTSPAITD